MARNRQRAKERQARRKAERQGAPGTDRRTPDADHRAADSGQAPDAASRPSRAEPAPAQEPVDPGNGLTPEEIRLQTGAPPQDVGRSDEVLEYEQDLDAEEDQEHFDPAEDQPEEDLEPVSTGPRGHRGEVAEHKDRPRFVQFLYAVVAELRRVQWPDRQTLTTLTGVVLGFVLIAGGYLGLLDAIFSRVIQAIL